MTFSSKFERVLLLVHKVELYSTPSKKKEPSHGNTQNSVCPWTGALWPRHKTSFLNHTPGGLGYMNFQERTRVGNNDTWIFIQLFSLTHISEPVHVPRSRRLLLLSRAVFLSGAMESASPRLLWTKLKFQERIFKHPEAPASLFCATYQWKWILKGFQVTGSGKTYYY